MVESEANELSEETMLNAVMFGFENFQGVIDLINELKAEAGKEPWEAPVFPPEFDELYSRIEKVSALNTKRLSTRLTNRNALPVLES